jgi:hypothetical protein
MPIANPIETGTGNTNEKKTKQRKVRHPPQSGWLDE